MWLNDLTIAIIEKNSKKMSELFSNIPEFENIEDAKKAQSLIKEALVVLYELKDETAAVMKQLKKNMDFVNSASMPTKINRLDITS